MSDSSPTLIGLPTKLIWDIHSWLDLQDACNLHLTNHWLEHQVLGAFTERIYHDITVRKSQASVDRLAGILARPQFAAAVCALRVYYSAVEDNPARSAKKPLQLMPERSNSPHELKPPVRMPLVSDVIAQLPSLKALAIIGLTFGPLESNIPKALETSGIHLSSLKLADCELTIAQLHCVLAAASDTLVDIAIDAVTHHGHDAWLRMLRALLAMPSLERCDLTCRQPWPDPAEFYFLAEHEPCGGSRPVHKWLRGLLAHSFTSNDARPCGRAGGIGRGVQAAMCE
ncbi:hypothetical protein LTR08_003411 [Meristemomyces frigidus]|nr:hypothetical protein LTR08_003411 [Meristemomyces frigidus]